MWACQPSVNNATDTTAGAASNTTAGTPGPSSSDGTACAPQPSTTPAVVCSNGNGSSTAGLPAAGTESTAGTATAPSDTAAASNMAASNTADVAATSSTARTSTVDTPMHSQSFTGHPAAIRAMAFAGDRLVSVGVCDAVYVWRLKGAAAALQQGHGALPKQHPDLNVVMRSWVQKGMIPEGQAGEQSGA